MSRELDESENRPITFVLGSGLSSAAIPDTRGATALAMELLLDRAPQTGDQIAEVFSDENREPSDTYGEVLRLVESYLSAKAVKGLVQELTLHAYVPQSAEGHGTLTGRERFASIDADDCHAIERDIPGWNLPRGLQALGVLFAQHPRRFTGPIITTNFDPLLEVAVRGAGRTAETLAFDRDGSLRPYVGGGGALPIAHLHGYWNGVTHTLHSAKRLTQPRAQLTGSLRKALANSLVVVIGYGGWDDVFSGALRAVVEEGTDIEVIWTLYDRRPDEWPPGTLLHELDNAGPEIHIYDEVDANTVLPALAGHHNTDPIQRLLNEPLIGSQHAPPRQRYLQAALKVGRLDLIRSAGASARPEIAVWAVRQRAPNIVHASQALVGRALASNGTRILALVNDVGAPNDPSVALEFEHRLRQWSTTPETADHLIIQRLRDQEVLFPRAVRFERWLSVLEVATTPRLGVMRALANAEAEAADHPRASWQRFLSPFIVWVYMLTLQERGLDLSRLWTLSGDHQRPMWQDFDKHVARGTAHLLVPALREPGIRAVMDDQTLRGHDEDLLYEGLRRAVGRRGFDQPNRLVPWVWQQLIALPPQLVGEAVVPLATPAGDIADLDGLLAALRGRKYRREILQMLSARLHDRLYG